MPQFPAAADPGQLPGPQRSVRAAGEQARPYRIIDRLEQLDVDTLIVWGRDDVRGKIHSAERAVTRMPRGHMVTFDECGHMPYLEQPERYNQTLRGFLAP